MTCIHHTDSCCPFAATEHSARAQDYGCLPTMQEIVTMRVEHGKTWACHDNPSKPCAGAIRHLKRHGLPHKVVDQVLVTELSPWERYVGPGTTSATCHDASPRS